MYALSVPVPRRFKAVIVSPHLDDAVFSCGGLIARLAREGPILILNLFTRFPDRKMVRAVLLGPERYEEERAAAHFLGVSSHNLDELDASFRRPEYRVLGNIFRPPVKEDLEDLDALRARVFGYLEKLEYERLYVPLGIGWHVDHMLTHAVFAPWSARENLFFYEDAPYCYLPHATRYRLNELGRFPCTAEDSSLVPKGTLLAWWEMARAYARTALMRQLRPWIVRQLAVPVVSHYLYRLLAIHRDLGWKASASGQLPVLKPAFIQIDDVFLKKVEAMALYRSQFSAFFSGQQDCVAALKYYSERMRAGGTLLERYWRICPLPAVALNRNEPPAA